jgi:hypothetical protein
VSDSLDDDMTLLVFFVALARIRAAGPHAPPQPSIWKPSKASSIAWSFWTLALCHLPCFLFQAHAAKARDSDHQLFCGELLHPNDREDRGNLRGLIGPISQGRIEFFCMHQ